MVNVHGRGLTKVPFVRILPRLSSEIMEGDVWHLRGWVESEHYTTDSERRLLSATQPPLGRPAATRAALIPIRKSRNWWRLPMGERRAIIEERSHHIATGLEYLPAIARRLYHSRGLGEPFDFLTWFEFSPNASAAFDRLAERLRATEEWTYVEREVEIRLKKSIPGREGHARSGAIAPLGS